MKEINLLLNKVFFNRYLSYQILFAYVLLFLLNLQR
jgi:hypothetical protein